ncbi:MAG TPA: alkaline phosphatase family protein [Flavobacteriales bacterium]|nr:alkaline phosphatase family protein [Flavobacteriales bacterium]
MSNFKYFIRLFVFWLLYFFVNRLFFIANYLEEFLQFSSTELLCIVKKSVRLDISFIAYLSVIITILLFFNSIILRKRFNTFISGLVYWINALFIVASALIIGGEVSLYAEWGTKLNFTALSHFANPSEVFSTATYGNYFTMLIAIFIAVVFVKIYTVLVHQFFTSTRYNYKQFIVKIIKLPIVLGMFLLLIRGGWKEIPINLSDAYFSNNIILNDVTVNPNWNLIQNVLKNKSNFKGNPYKKYSQEQVDKFIKSIKKKSDSTTYVLTNKNPNIVFILLESWSADNIESLGGLKGITPNFKALEKEGLSFTNFYSNGWTSDQGMSSIFSSFPVLPHVAIINQTDKARKLPSLNKSLSNYHSSYFFGGQLTYGNIKGYLLSQGFDVVKDESYYKHLPSGALGVHDEYMFIQFKEELKHLPEPFMSTLFTISSHSPFDFPAEHKLSFNSKEDKYVNSVAYTDKCLGDFMGSVKDENWYANTLFVIVADHSHNSPIKRRFAQKERFKIPMLWYGEVLDTNHKGAQWDKFASHIDITPTILSQMEINVDNDYFGGDIFDNNSGFIFYSFGSGYGMIKEDGNSAFSITYNKFIESNFNDSSIVSEAEMFLQHSFDRYLSY